MDDLLMEEDCDIDDLLTEEEDCGTDDMLTEEDFRTQMTC